MTSIRFAPTVAMRVQVHALPTISFRRSSSSSDRTSETNIQMIRTTDSTKSARNKYTNTELPWESIALPPSNQIINVKFF